MSLPDSESLSPLANVAATRAVLESHGLFAKHALGQHFLVNDGVVRKIVELARLSPHDVVLEVGPGIGTLSIALVRSAAHVAAVERDRDLAGVLSETLAPWAHRFTLIQKDALALTSDDLRVALEGASGEPQDPSSMHIRSRQASDSFAAPVEAGSPTATDGSIPLPTAFVANLPYAVAATLVLDYFERFDALASATVMVQREVADRMAARPGTKDYGAYTVKLAFHARSAGSFPVAPGNFLPPPHVESTVIRLERIVHETSSGVRVEGQMRRAACLMADAAFANRRKTLSNSCKLFFAGPGAKAWPSLIASAPEIGAVFERAGIDARRRGETLSLDEFAALGAALLDCERV